MTSQPDETEQSPRARRRSARRQELIDAAMAILVKEGVDALTIARLAQETGASVGGLYRYFPSKEAIFVALQLQAIAQFEQEMIFALDRAETFLAELEAPEEVKALVRALVAFTAYLDEAEVAPTRYRLLDAFLSAPDPVLTDEQARDVDAHLTPILQRYGQLLQAAASQGALREDDPGRRTYALWAALHGLSHFRKRDRIMPEQLRFELLTRSTLAMVLLGWGAQTEHCRAALTHWEELQRSSDD